MKPPAPREGWGGKIPATGIMAKYRPGRRKLILPCCLHHRIFSSSIPFLPPLLSSDLSLATFQLILHYSDQIPPGNFVPHSTLSPPSARLNKYLTACRNLIQFRRGCGEPASGIRHNWIVISKINKAWYVEFPSARHLIELGLKNGVMSKH